MLIGGQAVEVDRKVCRDGNTSTAGHHVVLARYTAKNKATVKAMEARVAHAFVVCGGTIVRFEQSSTAPRFLPP